MFKSRLGGEAVSGEEGGVVYSFDIGEEFINEDEFMDEVVVLAEEEGPAGRVYSGVISFRRVCEVGQLRKRGTDSFHARSASAVNFLMNGKDLASCSSVGSS